MLSTVLCGLPKIAQLVVRAPFWHSYPSTWTILGLIAIDAEAGFLTCTAQRYSSRARAWLILQTRQSQIKQLPQLSFQSFSYIIDKLGFFSSPKHLMSEPSLLTTLIALIICQEVLKHSQKIKICNTMALMEGPLLNLN